MLNKLSLPLLCLLGASTTSQAVHTHRSKNLTARTRQLEMEVETYQLCVNSLERPRAQLNLLATSFPSNHPAWPAAKNAYDAVIELQTTFQILQTEAFKSRLSLTHPAPISEKALRQRAATAAKLAQQEAQRYFIAGLAARQAQGRKISRQELEILKAYRVK